MTDNVLWTDDTFGFLVTFTEPDGTAFNLTGASVEAWASGPAGEVELTAVVSDGAAGQMRATAAADTFAAGLWTIQLEATQGGVTRTVEDKFVVKQSLGQVA